MIYWKLGRSDEALACAKRSTELAPYYRQAVLNYGSMLEALGNKQDAQSLYTNYARRLPGGREIEQVAAMGGR